MIALATCAALPDLDPDDRHLLAALGGRAVPAIWDDAGVDWAAFELVVVRNTWDYVGRRDEFLAWASRVGDRLRNPPEVLRWSTDKRYLGDLAAAGLPVVETAFVAAGEPLGAAPPVVVKPAVGAGSIDAARHDDARAAADHVARLGAALVQPYVEADETALMYLGGAYSHAVRKGPMLGARKERDASGLFVSERIEAVEATAAEREVADAVMAWAGERFGPLLYARVDVLGGRVLEVELAEPSLFFGHGPGSADRLARAILS